MKNENPITERNSALQQADVSRSWWNFQSKDDQIWLMMKYGYDDPLNPERVKVDEMVKMYVYFEGDRIDEFCDWDDLKL